MVLVVVAITTVLAVGMISRQQQALRRAGSLFSQDQAYLYALGAEDFIRELINQDTQDDKKGNSPRDALNEVWARPFPPFPVPGGYVRARLIDAQSRFNLNQLVQDNNPNQAAIDYFKRLLRQQQLPENLVYALVDWIDSDNEPNTIDGAEEDFYLRGEHPYRAANHALSSMSELRLVRGFTPDVIRVLEPYVSVLPDSAAVLNLNTMGPVLMQALLEGLSKQAADELVSHRPSDGYKSVDDFLVQAAFNGQDAEAKGKLKKLLGIKTQYFEMLADAEINERHSILVSVLQRGDSDTLKVISRDLSRKLLPPPGNEKKDTTAAAEAESPKGT